MRIVPHTLIDIGGLAMKGRKGLASGAGWTPTFAHWKRCVMLKVL
jgi:hypothetical protein